MTLSVEELRIKHIIELYGDSLFRLACTYLRNEADAQEVVQDTLIRLLRYDPNFADEGKEKAWLMKTTANLSRNRLRFNKVRAAEELDERFAGEEKEDLSFVWDAVTSLPVRYRETVHLFYHEGLSTKEIATVLGRSEAAVRKDLSRARQKLKELLKEAYDFE